jgi:aminoglycoside phosphotransferase (APT) family kinase protein
MARTARALAELHVAIHDLPAPPTLPALHEELQNKIRSAKELSPEIRDFAVEVLAGLPDGDRFCHGDFHVANVLGTLARPMVIDWPNATRGDPVADVAHTNILHRFGQPRQGTNALERTAVGWGRRSFGRHYLHAYRTRRPYDQGLFERWETVRAAARLSAGVSGEVRHLVGFLEMRLAAG